MLIYRATNIINGLSYIGQTIKTLQERKIQHLNAALNGRGNSFADAIRKYGEESFKWEVLELVETIEEIDEREVFWIEYFNTFNRGYNETIGGQSTRGYKYSQEEIDRIKRTKQNKSDEEKRTISIRQAQTKGIKPFLVFNLDGECMGEYQVGAWCRKELGIDSAAMHELLSGKRLFSKNYIVFFKEDFTNEALKEKLKKVSNHKKGERNSNSKITGETALKVKMMIKEGHKKEEIKEITGITESIYHSIKCGYSWAHIGLDEHDNKTVKVSKELSRDEVLMIRKLLGEKKTVKEISSLLDIPYNTIYKIMRNKTYKDII